MTKVNLEAISHAAGLDLIADKLISERRGASVIKLSAEGEAFALKLSPRSPSQNLEPGQFVEHEAQVMRLVKPLQKSYVASGSDETYNWLLVRWVDGVSAVKAVKSLESPKSSLDWRRSWIELALLMCREVEKVHEAGYLHGDIQPAHFIFAQTLNQVSLIDFGLCHEIGDERFPYPGAFVYYASPEVASKMISRPRRIPYDVQSEIYSLGATLFTLYTLQLPLNYGKADLRTLSFEEKLDTSIRENRNRIEDVGGTPFRELDMFFDTCMRLKPSDRYQSLKTITNELSTLQNSSVVA